jgi:hypothetical protein
VQNQEPIVTPISLTELIDAINALPPSTELIESMERHTAQEPPVIAQEMRFVINEWIKLRRTIYRLAHLAALPPDMWSDYVFASASSPEEWKRFCSHLPAPLWRDWTEEDGWEWPSISISLEFSDDGRIFEGAKNVLTTLIGIEAKRLRECRVCQKIFWATRIEKSGGPYGCSSQCNNTLRQRAFKEKERLAAKDRKRAK